MTTRSSANEFPPPEETKPAPPSHPSKPGMLFSPAHPKPEREPLSGSSSPSSEKRDVSAVESCEVAVPRKEVSVAGGEGGGEGGR